MGDVLTKNQNISNKITTQGAFCSVVIKNSKYFITQKLFALGGWNFVSFLLQSMNMCGKNFIRIDWIVSDLQISLMVILKVADYSSIWIHQKKQTATQLKEPYDTHYQQVGRSWYEAIYRRKFSCYFLYFCNINEYVRYTLT